jgi:hypothetical protein
MVEMKTPMAILSWAAAALLVILVHRELDDVAPVVAAVAKIVAIVAIGFAYVKISGATIEHALFAGVTWIALAIGTEMLMTARLGHAWFALVGSPGAPAPRYVLMFFWIAGPALFAWRNAD